MNKKKNYLGDSVQRGLGFIFKNLFLYFYSCTIDLLIAYDENTLFLFVLLKYTDLEEKGRVVVVQ